jgi:hypothetical protein
LEYGGGVDDGSGRDPRDRPYWGYVEAPRREHYPFVASGCWDINPVNKFAEYESNPFPAIELNCAQPSDDAFFNNAVVKLSIDVGQYINDKIAEFGGEGLGYQATLCAVFSVTGVKIFDAASGFKAYHPEPAGLSIVLYCLLMNRNTWRAAKIRNASGEL